MTQDEKTLREFATEDQRSVRTSKILLSLLVAAAWLIGVLFIGGGIISMVSHSNEPEGIAALRFGSASVVVAIFASAARSVLILLSRRDSDVKK